MTVRDETAALLALFDEEEMSEAAIAKATGLSRPQVTASLTVARSTVAAAAADRWDFLTLDQAATLAEFDNDQEALTALVQAAKGSPGQFDHLAAQLRANRAEREAKAAFTAELEAQGITVYGDRSRTCRGPRDLENLRDSDGNEITPEAHATCPGRAVTITYDWGWAPGAEAAYRAAHDLPDDDDLADVEFTTDEEAREAGFVPRWEIGRYLCTDPDQYGHPNVNQARPRPATPTETRGPPRTRPPRQRARPTSAAASGSGTTSGGPRLEVRSSISTLAGRKTPPAGALKPIVLAALARGETQPVMSSFGHETACELLSSRRRRSGSGTGTCCSPSCAHATEKRARSSPWHGPGQRRARRPRRAHLAARRG